MQSSEADQHMIRPPSLSRVNPRAALEPHVPCDFLVSSRMTIFPFRVQAIWKQGVFFPFLLLTPPVISLSSRASPWFEFDRGGTVELTKSPTLEQSPDSDPISVLAVAPPYLIHSLGKGKEGTGPRSLANHGSQRALASPPNGKERVGAKIWGIPNISPLASPSASASSRRVGCRNTFCFFSPNPGRHLSIDEKLRTCCRAIRPVAASIPQSVAHTHAFACMHACMHVCARLVGS